MWCAVVAGLSSMLGSDGSLIDVPRMILYVPGNDTSVYDIIIIYIFMIKSL